MSRNMIIKQAFGKLQKEISRQRQFHNESPQKRLKQQSLEDKKVNRAFFGREPDQLDMISVHEAKTGKHKLTPEEAAKIKKRHKYRLAGAAVGALSAIPIGTYAAYHDHGYINPILAPASILGGASVGNRLYNRKYSN